MTLEQHAQNIRRNILVAGHKAGAMHFGGSLSLADILATLYGSIIHYKEDDPAWEGRDRVILSKGHGGLALYAALCEYGLISIDDLLTVKQDNGNFPAQPKRNLKYGIEMSSGSLGLGLSFAIGQVLGLTPQLPHSPATPLPNFPTPKLYILVGNGEINEGSFWEAAMFAGARGLDNICVTIDNNGMQLDGKSADVLPVSDWDKKLDAFGWSTVVVDGHDCTALNAAYKSSHPGKPLAVIANTIKGKGVSFMENVAEWHHGAMTEGQFKLAMSENGGAV